MVKNKTTDEKKIYWDYKKTLSRNCLFNFIIGDRGIGKTYGCKQWAIDDFLKNEKQFVYVRRFNTEFVKIKKFFDDIKLDYINHTFEVKDKNFIIDGKVAGTYIALSTGKIEKSVPFPFVNKIIFDEFILDEGYHNYIPDEVTNFLELYSTIARLRDVRVMFISNALTQTNPYFLYFDLDIPYQKKILMKNDILIEIATKGDYVDIAKQTRFGKIIGGTPYGNYAFGSEFLRDSDTFIAKKPYKSTYVFTMKYKGNTFGVWCDPETGYMYVSLDYMPNFKIVYSLSINDHTPNTVLLKGKGNSLLESFVKRYKVGAVRFENMNIKNLCQEVLKHTL